MQQQTIKQQRFFSSFVQNASIPITTLPHTRQAHKFQILDVQEIIDLEKPTTNNCIFSQKSKRRTVDPIF